MYAARGTSSIVALQSSSMPLQTSMLGTTSPGQPVGQWPLESQVCVPALHGKCSRVAGGPE